MEQDFSNILSSSFSLEWQESPEALLIKHPQHGVLMHIAKETIESMSFKEAAEFIGSRLLLMIPATRQYFVNDSKENPEIISRP